MLLILASFLRTSSLAINKHRRFVLSRYFKIDSNYTKPPPERTFGALITKSYITFKPLYRKQHNHDDIISNFSNSYKNQLVRGYCRKCTTYTLYTSQ